MNRLEESVITTKTLEDQPHLQGWILNEAQRRFLESFADEDDTPVKEQH